MLVRKRTVAKREIACCEQNFTPMTTSISLGFTGLNFQQSKCAYFISGIERARLSRIWPVIHLGTRHNYMYICLLGCENL